MKVVGIKKYCSIHFLYHDIVCSNKPNYTSSSIPFLNWQWPFSGGKLEYLKKEYFEFAKSDTDIAGAPIEVSWKLEVVPLGCIVAPHFLSAKWCLVQLCSHFLMFLNESSYQLDQHWVPGVLSANQQLACMNT